ncbi:MAG: pilin, partial [Pseudomonadota bacterium]
QAYGMMQGAKTQVLETLALGAPLPANNDEFFSNAAADADIARIHWFSDGNGARIVADFGPGAGELENRRLWLVMDTTSSTSIIQWHCTTHPGASLAIPVDALPSECR